MQCRIGIRPGQSKTAVAVHVFAAFVCLMRRRRRRTGVVRVVVLVVVVAGPHVH